MNLMAKVPSPFYGATNFLVFPESCSNNSRHCWALYNLHRTFRNSQERRKDSWGEQAEVLQECPQNPYPSFL